MTNDQTKRKLLAYIGEEGFSGRQVNAKNAKEALTIVCKHALDQIIPNTIRSLKRNGYISCSKSGDGYRVTLTPAGAFKLQDYQLFDLTIPTPRSWDGKWRIVTYDMPANKKSERYKLITQLKRLGFSPLQQSLWVHPYDAIDITIRLASMLGVSSYIRYMTAEHLDPPTEEKLKKHMV